MFFCLKSGGEAEEGIKGRGLRVVGCNHGAAEVGHCGNGHFAVLRKRGGWGAFSEFSSVRVHTK